MDKVEARSASKETDDWPFWYVHHGGRNATREVHQSVLGKAMPPGAVFVDPVGAIVLAEAFNEGRRHAQD